MNGHYKVLHASGIIKSMTGKWILGVRQISCFVYFKCTRFLWKNKRIERGYTSCGTFWVKRRNDQCPPCHFRNSCGLENITLIKSERQKILSIFIYKNTWEYKKVAKQWGYRLKTQWIHWNLQFLLVRCLMLHLGEPQDSQCRVKRERETKKAFDNCWYSLVPAQCTLHGLAVSFHNQAVQWGCKSTKPRTRRVPYNDKEINYSQIEHAVCLGSFELLLVHYEVCLITTHRALQKKRAILTMSIQSNFINTLWRFLQRRKNTKTIVSSPSLLPLTKDGAKFPREK